MSGAPISNRKRRRSIPSEQVHGNTSGGGKYEDSVFMEMMLSAIIKHGLPLTLFEQSGTRDVFDYLKPNVKHISTDTAKGNCMEAYEKERAKFKHDLGSISGRLCLTIDIWVDPCTNDYLCLTANYVDSNWKLQSKFLNLLRLSFPWDASSLQSVVYDVLCKWGIEKKVFSITFDSGRCGEAVQDLLRECLNGKDGALLCNGDYLHVCCGARFIDHMGEECFKLIDNPISKIREGVHYIMGHEKNRLKFEEAALLIFQGEYEPLWSDSYLKMEFHLFVAREGS